MNDLSALAYTPDDPSSCPIKEVYALWHDVLMQAIFDLQYHPLDSRSSHRWFLSESVEIGSFLWICHTVGGSPEHLRKKYSTQLTSMITGKCKSRGRVH